MPAVVIIIIVIVVIFFDQHPHPVVIEIQTKFTAVTIERRTVVFAVEKVEVQFNPVVEVMAAVQADHDKVVLGDVGGGKDGLAVIGQQFLGDGAVADQVAVAMLYIQVQA